MDFDPFITHLSNKKKNSGDDNQQYVSITGSKEPSMSHPFR